MKDEKISAGLLARDEKVISWCIQKYSRLLWPVASAVLQNVAGDADVEECVADAFIFLWEKPEQFDPKRGSLKNFLCTVVRSRAIDRYRQIIRKNTVPLDEAILAAGFSAERELLQKERRQELESAIEEVGQPGREILVRRYYYGQKPREIALALGLSVKQVDNALYRVKRQLREVLKER